MKKLFILTVMIICSAHSFAQLVNSQSIEDTKERADLGDIEACIEIGNYYYDLYVAKGDDVKKYEWDNNVVSYYEKWINSNKENKEIKLDSIHCKAIYQLYHLKKDILKQSVYEESPLYIFYRRTIGEEYVPSLRDELRKYISEEKTNKSCANYYYYPNEKHSNISKAQIDKRKIEEIFDKDDPELQMMLGYIYGKHGLPCVEDTIITYPSTQQKLIIHFRTHYLESYKHYKKALDSGLNFADYGEQYVENFNFIQFFHENYEKAKEYQFNTKLSPEAAYYAMVVVKHLWYLSHWYEKEADMIKNEKQYMYSSTYKYRDDYKMFVQFSDEYGKTLRNIVDAVYFSFPDVRTFFNISSYSYRGRILYHGLYGEKRDKKRGKELILLGIGYDVDCNYAMAEILKESDPNESEKYRKKARELEVAQQEEEKNRRAAEEQKRKENAELMADKEADEGDADAKIKRGDDFLETDMQKAVSWYKKAADQGSSEALYKIGMCYRKVDKPETAEKYLTMAVEKNHIPAMLELGQLNGSRAEELYLKAANLGDLDAMCAFGNYYEKKEDYTKAVEWYRKAAEQGHAQSHEKLGYCYKQGKGVKKDYDKAREWFEKGAAQGLYRSSMEVKEWLEYDREKESYNDAIKTRIAQLEKAMGVNRHSSDVEVIKPGRSFNMVVEYYSLVKDYYKFNLSINRGSSKCYDIYNNYFGSVYKGYIWVNNGKITSVAWR